MSPQLELWVRPWDVRGPKPKWYRAYSVREYVMIPQVADGPPHWMARVVLGGTQYGKHPAVEVDVSEMVLSVERPADGPFTR